MSLEDKIQSVISSMNEGLGQLFMRILIALILIAGTFSYFAYDQFRGLNDPGAMEMSQLAHNLAEGRGFTTRCLRPLDIAYLERRGQHPAVDEMPDIRTAPLYPAVLSVCFRILKPSFTVGARWGIYAPESGVVLPLAGLLLLLTALVIYAIACRLFDARTAALATALFAVTESILAFAISGTEWMLATFLVTATFGCALLTVRMRHHQAVLWLLSSLLGGLVCGLAVLTAYSLVVIIPGVLLLLGAGPQRQRLPAVLAFIMALLIVVLPWMLRNQTASGSPIGLAGYSAIKESVLFEADTLERASQVTFRKRMIPIVLKLKLLDNLQSMHEHNSFPLYGGIVFCLFVAAIFHRFDGDEPNRAKWCTLLTLPLLYAMAALTAKPEMLLVAFPLVLVLGTGFYSVLEDRMEFVDTTVKRAIVLGLVLVSAGPAMLSVVGTPPTRPYPPYAPPFIAYVSDVMDAGETLCTDIPWATAWYGNRKSILLPADPDAVVSMQVAGWRIGGIYLTSMTGDKSYLGELVEGREKAWLPLLDRKVPEGFPWQYGVAIPPGGRSQLLLTDRERW